MFSCKNYSNVIFLIKVWIIFLIIHAATNSRFCCVAIKNRSETFLFTFTEKEKIFSRPLKTCLEGFSSFINAINHVKPERCWCMFPLNSAFIIIIWIRCVFVATLPFSKPLYPKQRDRSVPLQMILFRLHLGFSTFYSSSILLSCSDTMRCPYMWNWIIDENARSGMELFSTGEWNIKSRKNRERFQNVFTINRSRFEFKAKTQAETLKPKS